MAFFQYKGRNQRGEAVRGRIEAASAEAVATQLFNSGITPIDITSSTATEDVFQALRGRLGGGKVRLIDLALLSRQLYTLLKAGVPIMQSLRALRESTHNAELAQVLMSISENLDAGHDLSSSLRRHPQIFSSLYVALVQVGETTGRLPEVFLQLSQYLEREKDIRDRIRAATRYPLFVVIAMVAAVFIINIFVIPAFSKIYANFRLELPWATKLLIESSRLTLAYWPYVLSAVIAAAVGLRYYLQSTEGRYRWDRIKLRLPVTGSILFKATLGRFARALAVMIYSGVPLVQGMSVVSRAVDNEYIGERIGQMRDGVERGESLARTAVATGLFPGLVIQMLAIGEDTGAVDELMFNVADYYEREVDYDIRNLSEAIQPLLLVFLGAIVLLLALGVFLPMWDLVQAARAH